MGSDELVLEKTLIVSSSLIDDNSLENEIKFVFQCLGAMKELHEERLNAPLPIQEKKFSRKIGEMLGVK